MKLYTKPGACSLADHIVLRWIGQPFEFEVMDATTLKSPDYLAVNPAGNVPALEHEGWVLTQNAAILNYLSDTYPTSGLGGDGSPKSRAEINRWVAFLNADVHTAFHPLFGASAYLEDPAAIAASQDHARKKLRGLLEKIDAQLQEKTFLTGERSIADPYLFVILRWTKANQIDLTGLHNLDRFFWHMSADPGVAAAMAAEGLS